MVKALVEQINNVNYSQHQTSAATNYTNRGIIAFTEFFPSFIRAAMFLFHIVQMANNGTSVHPFIYSLSTFSGCLLCAKSYERYEEETMS